MKICLDLFAGPRSGSLSQSIVLRIHFRLERIKLDISSSFLLIKMKFLLVKLSIDIKTFEFLFSELNLIFTYVKVTIFIKTPN